jgi:hypothetical protein
MDFEERSASAPKSFLGNSEALREDHWRILVDIAKENGIIV